MYNIHKINQELRFHKALKNLPERGAGLHRAILGVCNLGAQAGMSEDELYEKISTMDRAFKPHEIEDAIQKALDQADDWEPGDGGGTSASDTPRYSRNVCLSPLAAAGKILAEDPERAARLKESLIQAGGGEMDPFGPEVRAASNPLPPVVPAIEHLPGSEFCSGMLSFLNVAYRPDEILYIGSRYESKEKQREHVRPVAYWIDFFSDKFDSIRRKPLPGTQMRQLMNLGAFHSSICVNPLTGEADEKGSFRSSGCVKEFRYLLLESDELPLNQKIPLLAGLELPVVAMTFSGNKSIHALVRADKITCIGKINDLQDWKKNVGDLFNFLVPLGFDGATKDPVRLSRLPGSWRPDKQKFQKLLFLNPDGGFHVGSK
ncbi:MAG: hypothetical protein PUC15_06135 [Lentisphaeria bacterium]|nr:hypothetical protein [Lentisphaeria bacterium]